MKNFINKSHNNFKNKIEEKQKELLDLAESLFEDEDFSMKINKQTTNTEENQEVNYNVKCVKKNVKGGNE